MSVSDRHHLPSSFLTSFSPFSQPFPLLDVDEGSITRPALAAPVPESAKLKEVERLLAKEEQGAAAAATAAAAAAAERFVDVAAVGTKRLPPQPRPEGELDGRWTNAACFVAGQIAKRA